MGGFLNDPLTFYALVGCAVALLLLIIICACIVCSRRNRNKRRKSVKNEKESVEMDSLLFVYERNTEHQQSQIGYASCPVSPCDKDRALTRSSSHLDVMKVKSEDVANLRRGSVNPADLDLKLYQCEEEMIALPYSGLGRLSLQLRYDKACEKLTVHVQQGSNIQSKHTNSIPSPYLKICLLPDKKRRMHSKTRKGENPVFDEDFVFSVPQFELEKRVLRIAVCDFDRFSRQTVLGYVVLTLKDELKNLLELDGTGELWKELSDNDALPGLNKGELLFSLSYLPTAGRMTIAVVKAKELNVKDDKESAVAVKVNLILNGKVVKSKKTAIHKQNLIEPTFNESFVYDISSVLLDRVSFIFIVFAYTSNSKRIIGRANTGPYMYSTGTGLSHWNDMLVQPRRAVSHWHKLM